MLTAASALREKLVQAEECLLPKVEIRRLVCRWTNVTARGQSIRSDNFDFGIIEPDLA